MAMEPDLARVKVELILRSRDMSRGQNNMLRQENKGTERETPGPALGICQFH